MAFVIDAAIWELFPDMRLVVAVGDELHNTGPHPDIHALLAGREEQLRSTWCHANAQSHPHVDAWRQAFKRMGLSSKRYTSSIESLCRRVLSGHALPRINPLVDYYNAVSLRHVTPVGGWDLDEVAGGEIRLVRTRGGELFTELGQCEPMQADTGEVGYADDRQLIARHFVWRQSEQAKITPDTRRFFLVSEVLPTAGREVAEAIRQDFDDSLRRHFDTRVRAIILDPNRPSWEWSATAAGNGEGI